MISLVPAGGTAGGGEQAACRAATGARAAVIETHTSLDHRRHILSATGSKRARPYYATHLQADRAGFDAARLRVAPVDDERAVADDPDPVALGYDLELVPVVLAQPGAASAQPKRWHVRRLDRVGDLFSAGGWHGQGVASAFVLERWNGRGQGRDAVATS